MSEDKVKKSGQRRVKRKTNTGGQLYQKREELLRQMQGTDEEAGHIGVREQLEALEKRGESDKTDEENWGGSGSRGGRKQWMFWLVLGLAVAVLCLGMLVIVRKGNENLTNGAGGGSLDFNALSGGEQVIPEDWFVANSTQVFDQAVNILDGVSTSEMSLGGVLPLVRDEEQANKLMDWSRSGRWAGFDTRETHKLTWEYGSSGNTGYMTLIGPRADYSVFRAYFVRDGENLRLDVDATEAYSEVPVIELAGKDLDTPVLMRAWIAKEPHFDARSDAESYSWYQILGPDLVDFVWAYAPTGSDLDEALRAELNYGRIAQKRIREFRGIITLTNAPKFNKDEFAISELLSTEWVMPNSVK